MKEVLVVIFHRKRQRKKEKCNAYKESVDEKKQIYIVMRNDNITENRFSWSVISRYTVLVKRAFFFRHLTSFFAIESIKNSCTDSNRYSGDIYTREKTE